MNPPSGVIVNVVLPLPPGPPILIVAGLAATLAVGALIAIYFLNAERTDTFNALHRALEAESNLKDQLQKTSDAEQEKTDKLWQSYLDRARAGCSALACVVT